MQTKVAPVESHSNPDPITESHGAHVIGTGIGAAAGGVLGGALAGAAIGTAVGPVGSAIGAALGAIAGGMAGKAVAESVNPTIDPTPEEMPVSPQNPESPRKSFLTSSPDLSHEVIARQAYDIWERKGRFDGHALDDWLQAEAYLQAGIR